MRQAQAENPNSHQQYPQSSEPITCFCRECQLIVSDLLKCTWGQIPVTYIHTTTHDMAVSLDDFRTRKTWWPTSSVAQRSSRKQAIGGSRKFLPFNTVIAFNVFLSTHAGAVVV